MTELRNLKIVDENNDQIGIAANPLYVRDFGLEVARGVITNYLSDNKNGRNIEVDSGVTADIWDGGHTLASGGVSLIWVQPTAARIHQITSTSGSDDSGGVGANTIRVFGLTSWTSVETSEDVTMDGTNDVPTVNSYVIINRMVVLTKGATGSNVGVITATADTDSTITAQIRISQGRTQQAIVGVPSIQTMYMTRLYGNINKAGGAAGLVDVALCVNPEPDAEPINCNVEHTFGLQTVGTSALTINYGNPKKIGTGGAVLVKQQVISGTNDMDVSGGFDYYLVTE